jgi:transposase
MRKGRPKADLELTAEELDVLERWARRGKTARRIAQRAEVILACASGLTNKAVAKRLKVSEAMVGKWRGRFVKNRLDGLNDDPRPGAPRSVDDKTVEEVVTLALETTPKGATHWSRKLMAKKVGVSDSTVGRIWRAFGLQPHRTETFQLSTDPFLVEKVRDVVGLYLNPPDNALVLCVDEKSQIQALNRTQPMLPMKPGQLERHTHEYKRNGTTTLFAALDHKAGNVIGKCFKRHRSTEFVKFLTIIDQQTEADLDVHVVLDNYSTHKTPAVKRWLLKHPRFHLHFTPTHASWLNLVERWFGLLTQRQIKRGSHHSVAELEAAIQEFLNVTNDDPTPFKWHKTADQILAKVERFARGTLQAHVENT